MIQIFPLLPGVELRCFRDARFKQGCLSVQLVRPMAAEEGAMNSLLPAVLLCAYLKTNPTKMLLYIIAVVGIVKLLTLYRSTVIFFRKKNVYLQNILYFCALEIVPACILAGILLYVSNFLRITL